MPYSADIARRSGGASWILRKGPDGAVAYPLRVFVNREPPTVWRNRYAVGAAVSGSTCGVVVLDRGEPVLQRGLVVEKIRTRDGLEIPIHRKDGVLTDAGGMPIRWFVGRKVVALVAQEFGDLAEFTDLLRRVCLYYRAAELNVVANAQGVAVIGPMARGEHCPLFLRPGASDEMGVSWKDRYGSLLTVASREAFFSVLTTWMDAEDGFEMPRRVKDSCLSVLRAETGALPTDVSPGTVLACATCAGIHAAIHAQEVGRSVEKAPPGTEDYGYKKREQMPTGDGAWWAYAAGVVR